jgi:hypothetical protein
MRAGEVLATIMIIECSGRRAISFKKKMRLRAENGPTSHLMKRAGISLGYWSQL